MDGMKDSADSRPDDWNALKDSGQNQKEMDRGQKEIDRGQKEMDRGQKEINRGQKEIDRGQKEINRSRKEMDRGRRGIDRGRKNPGERPDGAGGRVGGPGMQDMPENDRPYERCERMGPGALSDEELLSIIIRTGSERQSALETARQVLALNYPEDGVLGLCHLSLEELRGVHGVGRVKGIQLMCVGELSARIARRSAAARTERYDSPDAVADYYMEKMRHMEQEQLFAMFLDNKNRIIRDARISVGTVNTSPVPAREIFIEALRSRAVRMILVHNHPSGDPAPSGEDRLITERIRDGGRLIGIQLIDHVIIGDRLYFSFKREGIL